jgi:organic radical activating enzyme
MSKFKKSIIEFYITNVCNFNCDNCNRLNNYYFSGHDKWEDYKETYFAWSKLIDFDEISILGGEPLLNPTLDQWIGGIREFWPASTINIISNGTRLNYWHQRGLFDLISRTKTNLVITLHNRSRIKSIIPELVSYMNSPEVSSSSDVSKWIHAYNAVKDSTWPECSSYEDFKNLPEWIQNECRNIHKIDIDQWIKDTGVTYIRDTNTNISIHYAEHFVTAPLKYVGDNKFSVYNSNPRQAHDVCISKHCTQFIKGKMYKCHHVGLLPEFMQQFDVSMSDSDQQLLLDYRPLSVDDDQPVMDRFLKNLINPMPQCKLCPSLLEPVFLQSSTNKPKIQKIIPIKK